MSLSNTAIEDPKKKEKMKKNLEASLGLFVVGAVLIAVGFGGGSFANADTAGTVNQAIQIAIYVGSAFILLSLIMFIMATVQAGKEN